jgi:hypothetical protein
MIFRCLLIALPFAMSQSVTASTLLASFSTDSLTDGFVSTGIPGSWNCGEVTSGPLGGEQDTTACGTGLDGNYTNNASDFLRLPPFDVSSVDEPFLKFAHWWNIEVGDEGMIEQLLSDGSWEQVDLVYGYPNGEPHLLGDGGWVDAWVDLLDIEDTSKLRLKLHSNQAVTGDGWFVDNLEVWDGDIVPPILESLTILSDTEVITQPYSVTVRAFDNQQLETVELKYTIDGGAISSVTMTDVGGGAFQAQIPAQSPDTLVEYWVEAQDEIQLTAAPLLGTYNFRVRLPAPEGLSGPDEVIHDDSVWLSWSPPVSTHALYSYGIYRDGELVDDAYEPFFQVDLYGDNLDIFTVAARYELATGEIVEGDHSNSWSVDAAVPMIVSAAPSLVYQGDTVHLQIVGSNMLFVQGEVEVTVDSEFEILQVEIENVDVALITMYVSHDAMIGPRSVYLNSGDSLGLLVEAFTVVSGDDLPRIEEIVPNGLRQGQSEVVEFIMSSPMDIAPLVDLGPGVVVDSVELSTPNIGTAMVLVAVNAPLGARPAVMDDGVRAITGLDFFVRDQINESTGCHSVKASDRSGNWWLLLMCFATVIGRRNALR